MKSPDKKKDKKEAILDAALTLITKYGLHAVSMKMIASEANVAAGTIYVHFKNKEEMLVSLYHKLTDSINKMVVDNYNEERSFKENFVNIWSHILMEYIKDQRIPDFVNQYSYSSIDLNTDDNQLLAPIYDFLASAQKKKIVKDIPIAGLIALVHGPITSLIRMVRNTRFEINSIDVDRYAEACWDGIKNN